jgi:nucleotide-binding universal stress UspA family protein
MEPAKISLLVCTNGRPETLPALEMGVHLAEALCVPVTLFGVLEGEAERLLLEKALAETESRLRQAGVTFQVQREEGNLRKAIPRLARQANYLTVVGPLGRPAWKRLVQGRSFRRILAQVETPVLYVPEARWPIQRMLLCLGGLAYALGVEHVGLYLARKLNTAVTLLHVVEPVTLDYPTSRQVHDNWKDIMNTDTPQGRTLRQARQDLQEAGIEVEFLVRHGNIVHEIQAEIQHTQYDLVAMGSAYSSHSLRHLYMPNVTAEVAESVHLPLLTARLGHELNKEI